MIIDIDFDRQPNSMSRTETVTIAGKPVRLDPLYSMKKGDAAYHAVRRLILLGHIQPQEMLLEQRIAEQLNCSQGTVREAFLRLEQDGLVARRGYRGTTVSDTSVEEAAVMVSIRVQIECAGVRRAVPSLSADALRDLYALTDEMEETTDAADFYRGSELDRRFHMLLFQQSNLASLEPILNRCALQVHRFTYRNAEDEPPDPDFAAKHRALLSVFEQREADQAADAITAHIKQVIDRWAPDLNWEP